MYLALRRGRRAFTPGFTCPVLLRILLELFGFSDTGLSPSLVRLSSASPNRQSLTTESYDPKAINRSGLGSSAFARHY